MLTLYDIPSQHPGKAWSPHVWKARTALQYKGVPFQTEWVEYPDIEPTLKKLGVPPTGKWSDGKDQYTLPMLHDSSTGKYVGDSMDIAEYLDKTFPDKPLLFPFNSHAAIRVFDIHLSQTAIKTMMPIGVPHVGHKLNAASYEHFRVTREAFLGGKLEEISPPGPKRDAHMQIMKEGWSKIADLYASNGDGNLPFFFGDTFSYADCIVLGFMVWMRTVLGADCTEWKQFMSWSGGRWAKFVELTKDYQTVEYRGGK